MDGTDRGRSRAGKAAIALVLALGLALGLWASLWAEPARAIQGAQDSDILGGESRSASSLHASKPPAARVSRTRSA